MSDLIRGQFGGLQITNGVFVSESQEAGDEIQSFKLDSKIILNTTQNGNKKIFC